MKYFTKYLPVEGKIGIGDIVLHSGNPPAEVTASNIHLVCPDCKKVKLFLCSRDIQVEDQILVHHLDGKGHFESETVDEVDGDTIWLVNGPDAQRENCFKVIGEVSLKATWVKPDMEFDDSTVEIIRYGFQGNKYILIKFKCPHCGNFS